jgi:hypothetical protein
VYSPLNGIEKYINLWYQMGFKGMKNHQMHLALGDKQSVTIVTIIMDNVRLIVANSIEK